MIIRVHSQMQEIPGIILCCNKVLTCTFSSPNCVIKSEQSSRRSFNLDYGSRNKISREIRVPWSCKFLFVIIIDGFDVVISTTNIVCLFVFKWILVVASVSSYHPFQSSIIHSTYSPLKNEVLSPSRARTHLYKLGPIN